MSRVRSSVIVRGVSSPFVSGFKIVARIQVRQTPKARAVYAGGGSPVKILIWKAKNAISRHLESEIPLGFFCWGGDDVDSATYLRTCRDAPDSPCTM